MTLMINPGIPRLGRTLLQKCPRVRETARLGAFSPKHHAHSTNKAAAAPTIMARAP